MQTHKRIYLAADIWHEECCHKCRDQSDGSNSQHWICKLEFVGDGKKDRFVMKHPLTQYYAFLKCGDSYYQFRG